LGYPKLEVAFDRGKDTNHLTPLANFHVQPLLAFSRGEPLYVDLGEVIERERVLEALFQAVDRVGEALLVFINQGGGRPAGSPFIPPL
jgi:hypothetical protein